MIRRHDEEEGEKISWREIDRRKDRSPYAPKETPQDQVRSRRSEWVMKKYRKEADKLFMGKKGTKKHQKAHNDLDRYHGTDQFETAVKAYLDQYGLPDDWSTLSLLLDYSDSKKVLEALAAMKDLYEARSPIEKQRFCGRDAQNLIASNPLFKKPLHVSVVRVHKLANKAPN
jgi:hypothetical protein